MNEIMPSAATQVDLEITLLSDGSQTEKDKHYKIPLTCRIFLPFHTVYEKGKNWERSTSRLLSPCLFNLHAGWLSHFSRVRLCETP